MKSGFRLAMIAAALSVAMAAPAHAVMIGGFDFDDNAFVDDLLGSFGVFLTSGGSLESVLTDVDAGTWAGSFTSGAFIDLGFSDNLLVNGPGVDLAVFELGVIAEIPIEIGVGGLRRTYFTSDTGFAAGGFNLNVALIDLDDHGFGAGATVADLRLIMDRDSVGPPPAVSLVGALNNASIPEPGTLALLGLGLAGLGVVRRRAR